MNSLTHASFLSHPCWKLYSAHDEHRIEKISTYLEHSIASDRQLLLELLDTCYPTWTIYPSSAYSDIGRYVSMSLLLNNIIPCSSPGASGIQLQDVKTTSSLRDFLSDLATLQIQLPEPTQYGIPTYSQTSHNPLLFLISLKFIQQFFYSLLSSQNVLFFICIFIYYYLLYIYI